MKIAILGFGLEGKSLLSFLLKDAFYKDSEITVCDKNAGLAIPSGVAAKAKIRFQLGTGYLRGLNQYDLIFRSPGVPYNLPAIQSALKEGIQVSSATKLFFSKINELGCKVVGVAGTKGKGNTVTLIYQMLKACGKSVFLGGNIGKPATELLVQLSRLSRPQRAFIVLELSSFQLEDLGASPQIAVALDFFSDHLDVHKNFKEYISAEAGIGKWQKQSDAIFFFEDNKYSRQVAQKSPGRKFPVSLAQFSIFSSGDLKIPGVHNFKNAAIAANVCLWLGCPKAKIIAAAKAFNGREHRLEFVRAVRVLNKFRISSKPAEAISGKNFRQTRSGARQILEIKFYNDSAATIPQATAAAVNALSSSRKTVSKGASARGSSQGVSSPLILIAGGKDKKLDYTPLAKALRNTDTRLILLIGENKHKIQRAIGKMKLEIKMARGLEQATKLAYQKAKLIAVNEQSSVAVLLSPASASFDMFADYIARGKMFKELVKNL